AGAEESLGEVEFECDVQPRRPHELKRSLEESDGGPIVATPERPATGGCKPVACALREGCIGFSELELVARRLLQVVAEQLVPISQLFPALPEPVSEALVELRARRFRERPVGGVAHQQMAEAKGVLAGELGAVGADQLPTH